MQILDVEDEQIDTAMTGTNAFTINAEITKVLKKIPPRPVTDILIQHFFSDANWIYEMVCATTFTERYNEWWAAPCQSVDDIQFATLLLRLCSYTAQFLPSQNYTADTILGKSLSAIREQCHATAIALADTSIMNEGLPSITRIHEHFFHACYLKNQGSMKESWNKLSKAIIEAHELGIHLDSRKHNGRSVSEYDIEMGKRTYWNLWLWDKYVSSLLRQLSSLLWFSLCISGALYWLCSGTLRTTWMLIVDHRFMSVVLGRWPLIPDQRCTVSLPQYVFGTPDVSHEDTPNRFSERRLQIDLAKIASSILSSKNGKPCIEPATIDEKMEMLKVDLIEKLPPAFRLDDPDEKWDEQLPHLGRQRQMFRISVFATICMLLRPMVIIPASAVRALSASDRKLVVKHRGSLIKAAMEMLDSVATLHSLMGGKQSRFFLLSFFTFEPSVLIGIYLMTPRFGAKEGKKSLSASKSFRGMAAQERDMWKPGFLKMQEAFARLKMLSEVSSIARTALRVLEKMLVIIKKSETARSFRGEAEIMTTSSSLKSRSPSPISGHSRTLTHSQPSQILPSSTEGPSVSPFSGQHAFDNPITPSFPYAFSQTQDDSSLTNDTHNDDFKDQYGAYDNTMDWDMNFSNEMVTNSFAFSKAAAEIPWPGFAAQTAAADSSLMVANNIGPDIAMGQNFDWSWMDDITSS